MFGFLVPSHAACHCHQGMQDHWHTGSPPHPPHPHFSSSNFLSRFFSPHPVFWLVCSPHSSYIPGTFPLPWFVYVVAPDRKAPSSWKPLLTQAQLFTQCCLLRECFVCTWSSCHFVLSLSRKLIFLLWCLIGGDYVW